MQALGITEDQANFHVMDAHELAFDRNSFDLVIGFGILHHLEADVALKEIHKVLKPDGRVILQEPLADNPLLKIFRALTPNARTEDEEPFTGKAIRELTSHSMWNTELFYCGVMGAPAAMLTSILMPSRPNNWILRAADRVEQSLHERKTLLNWNQYVCFNMTKH